MSRLAQLGAKLFNPREEFRPKIVASDKRVRGLLNNQWIFDTTSALLVWEIPYFPHYWIPKSSFLPAASFKADAAISGIQSSTSRLIVGDKNIETLTVPDGYNTQLAGYVKIESKDLDAWYEEQSQVLYHPKDPFHRIDILPSGRHVQVKLAGQTLADTGSEGGVMGLWETNFPARWYLPRTAVNWQYLKPSSTKTGCPYKGEASYYDAVIEGKEHKDVVWWYENPTTESATIKGMLCFYPDKVETEVDGKAIEKVGMPKLSESDKASVVQPKTVANE
ncbi:hypothetical protein H2198_003512 [Neophaeococcomyces mojaviensis]|uniref:Uncharacterized protein n=1 Tax=Neophaeococcomyces mojaviensis TaxID=3383035 RepID=A0ACC3AB68_9EURO|nr:hypothetical protein H2198_003512 [Knufia sp. JES_112]